MRMPYADEEKGYPDVKLDQLATGKWLRPRARIIGEVVFKKREEDGDLHLSLKDGNHFVVCEFIPELMPEDLPSVNDRVEIWGVVRYDGWHKWWELHPVIGWKKAAK
jgi:hypothetical protein